MGLCNAFFMKEVNFPYKNIPSSNSLEATTFKISELRDYKDRFAIQIPTLEASHSNFLALLSLCKRIEFADFLNLISFFEF